MRTKTHRSMESGLSMIEMVIAIGLLVIVLGVGFTQFGRVTTYFATMRAEASANADLVLAAKNFKTYFQTKWMGGLFNCAATPVIGRDSYCVVPASCSSMSGTGYTQCRSLAIIRGDPLDPSTNPDRINISTACKAAPAGTAVAGLELGNSVCGRGCPRGQIPVTTFTRTKADGTATAVHFPGGTRAESWRDYSADQVLGLELCASKPDGGNAVTVDLQAYFITQKKLTRRNRQFTLSEQTMSNPNIQILP